MRGSRDVPLAAIAAMAGIDRKYLYEIIMGFRRARWQLILGSCPVGWMGGAGSLGPLSDIARLLPL